MDMEMEFSHRLPMPIELKEQFPATDEMTKVKDEAIVGIQNILSGASDKFLIIMGPCSADNEDAVLDYVDRLRGLQEKVKDKILIIPRIYTNKPRTTGEGYKGMLHQPDPNAAPDLFSGIIAIRKMFTRILKETGMPIADEMLYPENHRYFSDIISYVAVGARSTENQFHRLTASGLGIPVGMKNPTSGDFNVMLNSITAAQGFHRFIYRGWAVESKGNPYAHCILRGRMDKKGGAHPNYHYEDIILLADMYEKSGLLNPAVIIDTNHSNSNKQYEEQIRIANEVMHYRRENKTIEKLVKGLMIESYIEDGACSSSENIYGKSITDPCLGWEKSESLILQLADRL